MLAHDATSGNNVRDLSLRSRFHHRTLEMPRRCARVRAAAMALILLGPVATATLPTGSSAQSTLQSGIPVKERHTGAGRTRATQLPRSESDQALVRQLLEQ